VEQFRRKGVSVHNLFAQNKVEIEDERRCNAGYKCTQERRG
jgi:hypothetical protein